jgi:GTPase SAR1 family protein
MFGQLVIGPCGSGKSTYCRGMKELMVGLGRTAVIVNLDPSNDEVVYDCDLDIRELIKAEEVATETELGPNAVQIYCIDLLSDRLDWFGDKLRALGDVYLLFDCPGQFELYTDSCSMNKIVTFLTRRLKIQLAAITLVDCLLCASSHSYISAVLMSLSMMIHLELPHVNVLSKMDTLRRVAPEMAFNLEFYLKGGEGNLQSLVQKLFPGQEDRELVHPLDQNYSKFVKAVSDVSEEFSLVSFVPLAIEDKELALHCLAVCDRANGYSFSADGFTLQEEATKADTQPRGEYFDGLREKFQEGPFCSSCGKDAKGKSLLRCGGCKKVEYCNRDCQKADWPSHKRICNFDKNPS